MTKSYGHRVQLIGPDHYRLSWCYDVKYSGSRLRYPRTITRDTDTAGALRFAKRWNLTAPMPNVELTGDTKAQLLGRPSSAQG